MSVQGFVELVDVPLDARFAWFDVSLISEESSLVVFGASGLSGPIVPNVEAKEVKPSFLLPCIQGVRDSSNASVSAPKARGPP